MGNIEDKEENVRSLLDSFAGRMKMKKTRPISNLEKDGFFKKHVQSKESEVEK